MKTAVFAFGRFNPPTIGHEKLIDAVGLSLLLLKKYLVNYGTGQILNKI